MSNVASKASRLGLEYGQIKGYVTVKELAAVTGKNNPTIWAKAKRHGVLKVIGKYKKRAVVPERWAKAIIEESKREREGDEARRAGYLRIKEAAAYLGVGFGTVQRGLQGKGYLARLKDARVLIGKRGTVNINPLDLERLRLELQSERDAVRSLKSAKSLWLDSDLERSTAMTQNRKRMASRNVLKGGRIQTFFYPEAS